MEFFGEAVNALSILVIALGAGLGIWGVVNLLEGYGQDNPASNGQGAYGNIQSRRIYGKNTKYKF